MNVRIGKHESNMNSPKICSKCVLDSSVPDIRFDQRGECNYCKLHRKLEKKYPCGEDGQGRINAIIKTIRNRGRNRRYDCIVGVSGGTDSTHCLYLAKGWKLRPLAVHLDNGWNSEIAISNIKNAVNRLDVDLKIVRVKWEEFRDLQIAFLRASVPDIEIPTDIGIYATLFKVAAEENIVSIINGHSFRTEGTAPIRWTYMDGRYIESVFSIFSKGRKLEYFPNLKASNLIYYSLVKRIKEYRPLEYLDYDKAEAGKKLENRLGWKYYGGHHYESIYTRFVASYILVEKFGIDKRKVSLSAQVRSGKITRYKALAELQERPYPLEKIRADRDYVLKKLGISTKEFESVMAMPPKSFLDYPTYITVIRKLRPFIRIACKVKLLPEIFYEKYAK